MVFQARLLLAIVGCGALAMALGENHLIAFNESYRVWMNQSSLDEIIFSGKRHNFIDITADPEPVVNLKSKARAFPDQPSQRAVVEGLIAQIDIDLVRSNLVTLSSFFTRYYTSQTGVQAAQWIYSELVAIKGSRDDVTVNYFNHAFAQPSIIARIAGAHDGPTSVVILGSHLDSVGSSPAGQSPGADDDGSGTVCNIEVFRLIVNSNFVPLHPLEFHYYAGEEAGLLGSQGIANDYSRRSVDVYAMMQLDMTMYPGAPPVAIAPLSDFTSPELTGFIKILIDTYCNVGWVDTRCGYGCSDHASWFRTGVATVMPAECTFAKTNPNIHTARDVIANLDLEHGREFVKLALAHVVELGSFVDN